MYDINSQNMQILTLQIKRQKYVQMICKTSELGFAREIAKTLSSNRKQDKNVSKYETGQTKHLIKLVMSTDLYAHLRSFGMTNRVHALDKVASGILPKIIYS